MHTEILTIPCLQDNYAYIIHNHKRNETFLIDAPEALPIIKKLEENNWKLNKIIFTHHHSDHVMGTNDLVKKFNPILVGSEIDTRRLPILREKLKVNEILNLGNLKFDIMDAPGHTIGHLAFYCQEIGALFTGDSLMSFGCGRLFEGTPEMMWNSLKKLKSLPDDTKVYCGHEYTLSNAKFLQSVISNDLINKKIEELKKLELDKTPSIPSTIKEEKELNLFFQSDNSDLKIQLNMKDKTDEETFAYLRNLKDNF